MSNPIQIEPLIVEVTRGGQVESQHRLHLAVVDRDGRVVLAAGERERLLYPRSAIKILQSLPLAQAVLAGQLSLAAPELALACSSHSGTADQVAVLTGWLAREGIDSACLHCGAHRPYDAADADRQAAAGVVWHKLHNNCSGKHSGFLALAKARGEKLAGYHRPDHPVQQRILGTLEHFAGLSLAAAPMGIDGCGIPTYALPLGNLALAFARLAEIEQFDSGRAEAVHLLIRAIAEAPLMVAGPGRLDSQLIPLLPAGATCKTGAEGVYAAALPALGLGLALKVEDGNPRASEFALVRLLARLGQIDPAALPQDRWSGCLRNWAGEAVGELRFQPQLGRQSADFPL